MKYICFEDTKTKWLHAVVFPDMVSHSSVKVEGAIPFSAGFCKYTTGECFGESESLQLKSCPTDFYWVHATLTNNSSMLVLLNTNRVEMPEGIPRAVKTAEDGRSPRQQAAI